MDIEEDTNSCSSEYAAVHRLRREAEALKDCFTRFSFQGLAISSVMLGAIAKLQEHSDRAGLLAVLPILLLLAIASIGTHKYSTANRLLGYELHLERVLHYPTNGTRGWVTKWSTIGWEEAMRAWRVVTATLFEYFFSVPTSRVGEKRWFVDMITNWGWRLRPEKLKPVVKSPKGKTLFAPTELWFEPATLLKPPAAYYAGGYLRTMLNIIFTMIVISFVPIGLWAHHEWGSTTSGFDRLVVASLVVVVGIGCLLRFLHILARLRLLESSFLSIHACAITWHAVVRAHFEAIEALHECPGGFSHDGYTAKLGEKALEIVEQFYVIHDWTERPVRTSTVE